MGSASHAGHRSVRGNGPSHRTTQTVVLSSPPKHPHSVPRAQWATKQWPLEKWLELGHRWIGEILFNGPEEQRVFKRWALHLARAEVIGARLSTNHRGIGKRRVSSGRRHRIDAPMPQQEYRSSVLWSHQERRWILVPREVIERTCTAGPVRGTGADLPMVTINAERNQVAKCGRRWNISMSTLIVTLSFARWRQWRTSWSWDLAQLCLRRENRCRFWPAHPKADAFDPLAHSRSTECPDAPGAVGNSGGLDSLGTAPFTQDEHHLFDLANRSTSRPLAHRAGCRVSIAAHGNDITRHHNGESGFHRVDGITLLATCFFISGE